MYEQRPCVAREARPSGRGGPEKEEWQMDNNGNSGVHVNALAEEAVVRMASTLFNFTAQMDPEAMRKNVELAAGGMPVEDRTVRAEQANYLLSRISVFTFGLVMSEDFRYMVRDAVAMEIQLEGESGVFVQEIRADMARGVRTRPSKGNYVVNLSRYNDNTFKFIMSKVALSAEVCAPFDREVQDAARALSPNAQSDIGFIVSNFMYLIRAFAKNLTFTDIVQQVLRDVQRQLDLRF